MIFIIFKKFGEQCHGTQSVKLGNTLEAEASRGAAAAIRAICR